MTFLDVSVFCAKGKLVTNVYRRETFTGAYTNFSSFPPLDYKFGLIHTLLHRCFCLVSDMSKNFEKHMEILLMNKYSNRFIDKYIFKFMNKLSAQKRIVFIAPQKQAYIFYRLWAKFQFYLKMNLLNRYLMILLLLLLLTYSFLALAFT